MIAHHLGFDADQDCSAVAKDAVTKGAEWVGRYLKNLSLRERDALIAAGLKIVSIFETTADRALSGQPGGVKDGLTALSQAQSLGQTQGTAIYATADFGESPPQDRVVLAYFTGFKEALGGKYSLGVYGQGSVCSMALEAKVAEYAWLSGGALMRGTREFVASARATILQDVGDKRKLNLGIGIDSDIALSDDYGAWSRVASKSVPGVIPSATDLQTALQQMGYYRGRIDGDFGPQSQAALGAYYHR